MRSVATLRIVFALGVLASAAGLRLGASEAPAPTPSFAAQVVQSLPAFQPRVAPAGVIRLWGHGSFSRPFMRLLVARWIKGFARYHPDIKIEEYLYGTSSAIPALVLGVGDLSILGEEILPEAVDTFERMRPYPPFGVDIATGSVAVRNFDYAQMFFVHKDNPLSRLTLAQLDAIFGAEHRRGPRNIRTWGEVGLTGEWANKPITPYGWKIDDSFGFYLESTLLAGSHRWNNALREFAHITRPDGTIYDHGQQILDALANDRYGIAVSNIRYAGPDVKALALAEREGAPSVNVTPETLITQKYPLTRLIPADMDRAPGQPLEPRVKEFLRYILSREGQQDIVDDGRYLPLNPAAIAEQLRKLE
jgi:phosphate transport system substrate-binding protein